MHIRRWLPPAILMLAQIRDATASAILHVPALYNFNQDLSKIDTQSFEQYSHDYTVRARRTRSTASIAAFESDLDASTSSEQLSPSSIQQSCLLSIVSLNTSTSPLPSVSNPSALLACYNILAYSSSAGGTSDSASFTADLRLFSVSSSPLIGPLANVPVASMAIMLNYPRNTEFNVTTNANQKRQVFDGTQTAPASSGSSTLTQVQWFSLTGELPAGPNLRKLNTTQILSLMVPQISIEAVSPNDPGTMLSVPLPASDTAYFTAGIFGSTSRAEALQAADPATTSGTITEGESFLIPGQTLGIFPTGLIVTSAWIVIFVAVFGLGTLGRVRSRGLYRARVAAQGAVLR